MSGGAIAPWITTRYQSRWVLVRKGEGVCPGNAEGCRCMLCSISAKRAMIAAHMHLSGYATWTGRATFGLRAWLAVWRLAVRESIRSIA